LAFNKARKNNAFTKKEAMLLKLLIENKNEVVSRREKYYRLWRSYNVKSHPPGIIDTTLF